MKMDEEKNKAETFLENLLSKGSNVPCDETSKTFNETETLPPFYNEELFKRGQQFYHNNIFSMFACKFFGLLSVLVIPSIIKILVHTKRSGSEFTAYRRYLATIFHMTVWYDYDFKPGSRLWQSIAEVKNLHNSASKSSCSAGLHRINQKDMVLTQFGFMGYAIARSQSFGIYNATKAELEGFVHLWRVIGHLMGIEDRFNMCSGSVDETQEICNLMIDKLFRPHAELKDKEFFTMASYMTNGLWCIAPILQYKVVLRFFYVLLSTKSCNNNINNNSLIKSVKLSYFEMFVFWFFNFTFYTLQWKVFKVYHNSSKYLELWLMHNFPFLAYYKFGRNNSHVKILVNKKIT